MFRGCSGNVSICSTSGLEPTTFADGSTTIRPGRAGALCDKFPIFITVAATWPHQTGPGSTRPPLRRSQQPDPHSLALLCPCYGSPDSSSSVLSQQETTQVISGHYGSTQDKRSPHSVPTPCLTQKEQESEPPAECQSSRFSERPKQEMAPQVGLEPTTLRLTAECSAIELLRSVVKRARSALA